jgi:small subunit ribosomal protein S1
MSDQPESTTDLSPGATPVEPQQPASASTDHAQSPAAAGEESSGADAAGEDEGGEEGGEGEGSSAEGAAAADGTGAPGEGKKRRRRRRKKKPADGTEGARPEGAPEGARADGARHDKGPREPRNDLPLSRFLDPHGSRKSPFTAGDVVGGRVIAIQQGVAVIDLFGHGIAFAQSNEPRTLPVAPAEAEEVEAPAEGHPDAAAIAHAAAELEGQVGMPASESAPAPAPMSAGDVAVPSIAEDAPPIQSDPALVGRAARALRRVGTPSAPADQSNGEHEDEGAAPGGTSSGAEEAPASDGGSEEPDLVIGQIFRGRVASVAESGTMAISNRSIIRADARARLAKAREEHRRVFGMVFGYNRGGFDVLVEGMRAFCPVSGMTLAHLENADDLVGQRLEFSVQAAKGGHQGIVVSRRSILEREARKRGKELRKSLRVGQRMKGRVTQVREFGVFVDLGGIEGLVHMSEVSWDRSVRPEQAAKVGDEVDVEILRIGGEAPPPRGRGRDRDRQGGEGEAPVRDRREDRRMSERVALSMKAAQPDPWHTKLEGLAEGTAHKGKITRTTEFGAFVELVPGIEGLLHITELGRDLRHANERVKEGEEILVVIERVDIKGHRISLSRVSPEDAKAFAEGTLEAQASGKVLKPGSVLKVKVDRIEVVGLHVQVEGVIGRRGRGFIPNAEMGTERGTDHRKKFPVGTEIEVKVIGLDRDGGLRLSRKAVAQDEERRAIQDYRREASQKGFGTFGDILKSKLQSKS